MLIDEHENACLTDFGLSLLSEASAYHYGSIHGGGAIRWQAPELIDPEPFGFDDSRPTPPCDIFSLACMIIEVCIKSWRNNGAYDCDQLYTGGAPLIHLNNRQVSKYYVDGKRPPRPSPPDAEAMSDALWVLVESCWKHQPTSRPPTTHVVARLRTIVFGADIEDVEGQHLITSPRDDLPSTLNTSDDHALAAIMQELDLQDTLSLLPDPVLPTPYSPPVANLLSLTSQGASSPVQVTWSCTVGNESHRAAVLYEIGPRPILRAEGEAVRFYQASVPVEKKGELGHNGGYILLGAKIIMYAEHIVDWLRRLNDNSPIDYVFLNQLPAIARTAQGGWGLHVGAFRLFCQQAQAVASQLRPDMDWRAEEDAVPKLLSPESAHDQEMEIQICLLLLLRCRNSYQRWTHIPDGYRCYCGNHTATFAEVQEMMNIMGSEEDSVQVVQTLWVEVVKIVTIAARLKRIAGRHRQFVEGALGFWDPEAMMGLGMRSGEYEWIVQMQEVLVSAMWIIRLIRVAQTALWTVQHEAGRNVEEAMKLYNDLTDPVLVDCQTWVGKWRPSTELNDVRDVYMS